MSRTSRLASRRAATGAAVAAAASLVCALFSPAASAAIPGSSLNPTLWLRADALNGVDGAGNPNALPASNSSVVTWVNVGTAGAAQNAAQATAAQRPTFVTSVVNGKPVVTFDGNGTLGLGDYLSFTGALANTAASKLTVFFVSHDTRPSNDNNARTVLSTRGPGGWTMGYEPINTTTQRNAQRYAHINSNNVAEFLGADQFHLLEMRRDGSSVELGHGGVLTAPQTMTGFTASGLGQTLIGTNETTNATRFFKGDVAEIIAFDGTKLTDAERQQVESYLTSKYSIAAVPEPTGLAVLGVLAAAPLLGRRRARAASR